MPAYNARLRPKELFGLPLWGVVCALVTLVFGFMALIIPVLVVKIILGLFAAVALVVMFVLFALGEDVAFMRVRWLAKREAQGVTYEVGSAPL